MFNGANQAIATINPLGNRTSFGYDSAGNPIRVQNALGQIATSVFDNNRRQVAQVDALGNRYSFSYDSSGNRVAVKNPLGKITTSVFDTLNQLLATINPLGQRTTSVTDSRRVQTCTINALGQRVTNLFDAAGQAPGHDESAGETDVLWLRQGGAADTHPGSQGLYLDDAVRRCVPGGGDD